MPSKNLLTTKTSIATLQGKDITPADVDVLISHIAELHRQLDEIEVPVGYKDQENPIYQRLAYLIGYVKDATPKGRREEREAHERALLDA